MIRYWLAKILGLEPAPRSAPPIPPGTECECGAPATEQWYPNVCALADEPKEWVPLCRRCDVRLNELVVRFLYGSSKDEVLDRYRAEKGVSL